MRTIFSAIMAKPVSEANTSNRKSKRVVLLVGLAILLGVVLVIASTKEPTQIKENTIGENTMPNQPLASSSEPALETVSTAPTQVATAIPTLLPTFTPIPTSTPTEEPAIPIPSPVPENTKIPAPTVKEVDPAKPAPLPTPVGVYSWTLKVPVLMYHYISDPPEDADKYRTDLSVSPDDFQDQMAYLAENGFEAVDFYDLSLAITGKRDLPEKPVIITMDDGYRDNYENAFPILQEHGYSATFFIVTQHIDDGNETYLSWDMVEEMADAGMRIEPHSKTHADLSIHERDYIIYEVLGSQETIAAHTGHTPRFFCYPGGSYNDTTIEVLSELNFWGAVTTAGGKWLGYNERYEWPRIRMRNTTALAEFASFVDPGDTVSGRTVDS